MKDASNPDGELKELRHDALPGYPKKFNVVLAIAALWLVALFVWGSFAAPAAAHH